MLDEPRRATVVVIGAGQAGLSAAYHLRRRGFASAIDAPAASRTFVVLDADDAPGGAWRHRWESLRMATVNGIFDLPGMPTPPFDPDEPSRDAVPAYFAAFERTHELAIMRPVRVTGVWTADDGSDPNADLVIETDRGDWLAHAVINATGTWANPTLPVYRGQESFLRRQLHPRDYVSAEEFAGQRVTVVGGGISAIQQLEEISRVATTFWYTRREPVFIEGVFSPETTGRETIAKVVADVEIGRPTGSVVSYTGLSWTPYARRGRLMLHPDIHARLAIAVNRGSSLEVEMAGTVDTMRACRSSLHPTATTAWTTVVPDAGA